MISQTLSDQYPIINNMLQDYDGIWHVNANRRHFILRNLRQIAHLSFDTPKLSTILTRFLAIEKQNALKDGITVLRHDLINTFWDIINKIKACNNSDFKSYIKHKHYQLKKPDLKQAKAIEQAVLTIYQNLKHPQFTANVELQQYCTPNKFYSDLAISNYQARILFNLNFQCHNKPLIPVIFSSAKFKFNSLNDVTPQIYLKAIDYYKKSLLFHFFKNPAFGRVEIGVKSTIDYNYNPITNCIIHLHAFVDPNEYALFKMAAKKQRYKARKAGKYNHLLDLKCRELKKKQNKQSHESFLQRECDYSLKFATLEGMDNKDYYNPKTTRLNTASDFHQEHTQFITQILLPLYKTSLLFRKAKFKSYSECKSYLNKNNLNSEYTNLLVKAYSDLQALKPIKSELKSLENVPVCPTKTPQQPTNTVSDLNLKIEPVTKSKIRFFDDSLKQILPKFFRYWPQKPINKRKPPD